MTTPMHIGIVGPVATMDIVHLLDGNVSGLPEGYGGGPLLATLIGELLQRGHRVSAFTTSCDISLKPGASVTAEGKHFSMTYCPMRPRAWRPNGWQPGRIVDLCRFERQALQQAIAARAPDVIHAHWAYEFALAALAAKVPHVVTCHDSPYVIARLASRSKPTVSAYRWLRVLMARKALREAQCVTAVSPYMRDQVQSLATARIAVVPNPVDDLALSLARGRQAPAAPRLAMVCNGWDARKNPQPALRAFAQLRKSRPGAELHLYGNDFGSGQKAESWCVKTGIAAGMAFHGSVPHQRLLQALAECDLLLHPSLEESFGLVVAEAMAMGLPVVAGASSGAVPWVAGEHGSLCDVRDPEAILLALEKTLAPDQYARMSRDGMASVQARFSTARVVDAFFHLYEQALDSRAAGAGHTARTQEAAW